MTPTRIEQVTGPVAPGVLRGLEASVDGLWEADARRHDPLVSSDWPGREAATYLRSVADDPASLLLAALSGTEVVGHLVGRFHDADGFRTSPVAVLESMQVDASRRGQESDRLCCRRSRPGPSAEAPP